MRLSVEEIFFYNFALDALVILAALRHRVKLRPLKVLAAATVGGLYASLTAVLAPAPAYRVASALLMAPAMARIASGKLGMGSLIGTSAALLSVSAFMACVMGSFSGISTGLFFTLAALSAVLAGIVMGLRRRTLNRWEARIALSYRGEEARFDALVDTGNHLTEPISGLAVMLVEYAAIARLLPEGFDPASALNALPRGFRIVGYGGVGGSGSLGCFLPDELFADTGRGMRRMGDLWVAVYPGKLPGGARALAPPTFLNH